MKNKITRTMEIEGTKIKYKFDALTIEQVEAGRSIAEYVHNTNEKTPESINDITRSNSYKWLIKLASFIFNETDENGNLKEFKIENAGKLERVISKANVKNYEKIKEGAEDFFYNIGKPNLGSILLADKPNPNRSLVLEMMKSMAKEQFLTKSTNDSKS